MIDLTGSAWHTLVVGRNMPKFRWSRGTNVYFGALRLAALLIAIAANSGAASAAMCQKGYEKKLADATASGDAQLIDALRALPPIPVYAVDRQVICHVKMYSDLGGDEVIVHIDNSGEMMRDPKKYAIASGRESAISGGRMVGLLEPGYDPLVKNVYGSIEQLRINEQAIHVAEGPARERAVVEQVRRVDFAGVKIGQTLQEVLDILLKGGYSQEASGENLNIYKNAFRYSVSCGKQRIELGSSGRDVEETLVSVCHVGPLILHTDWGGIEFSRIDSDGNKYVLLVAFTDIDDINRTNALMNARVYEINARMVMKALVGSKYYETLADEKYGKKRLVTIAQEDTIFHKYAGSGQCLDCLGTGFRVRAEVDGLTVRIKDEEFRDSLHEALVEKLLATARRETQTVARPKF